MPPHLPGATAVKRASVSGPGSSHINQHRCKSEREGRDGAGGVGEHRGGEDRRAEEDRGGTETSASDTGDCSSHRFGFVCLNSFLFSGYMYIFPSSTPTHTHTAKSPWHRGTVHTAGTSRRPAARPPIHPLPPASPPPGCVVIMKQPSPRTNGGGPIACYWAESAGRL